MKYKIHLPTENFGFIEAETEDRDDALLEYQTLKRLYSDQTGLDDKTWRAVLDRYLRDGDMEADLYEEMNLHQKGIIQEIKKSIKRQRQYEK